MSRLKLLLLGINWILFSWWAPGIPLLRSVLLSCQNTGVDFVIYSEIPAKIDNFSENLENLFVLQASQKPILTSV
jgi:hypothetical protein